jgi:hypothetical protein
MKNTNEKWVLLVSHAEKHTHTHTDTHTYTNTHRKYDWKHTFLKNKVYADETRR